MISLAYNARVAAASSLNLPGILPITMRPRLLNLKLTENCNSRCITCDDWRTHREQRITTQRAKDLLEELKALGVKNLRLTGGEPLLRQDLFEILDACGEDWFDGVTLATNGLLLSRYADRVNASIITRVSVSLDAIGARNDRIRGIKGHYNAVVTTLPSINKDIKIASTFTKELLPDLEELILFCKEHGYGYDVNLLDAQPFLRSSKEVIEAVDALRPSEDEIEHGIQLLSHYSILPNYVLANAKQFMVNRSFEYNHCMLGYMAVNIDSRGDVTTGCIVYKPVGNIRENKLEAIIDSTLYRDSARRMYRLDCPLCGCGYSFSATCKKPWRAVAYALQRIR